MVLNEGLEVLGTDEYKPDGGMYCGAFEGSGVRKVKLPSTLKRLEYSTFEDCENLRNITLPEGLEFIGKSCFRGSRLEQIVFPRSTRKVCPYAFAECKQLRSASLNEGLETFGAKECVKN